jgi:hypothetical protein
MVEKSKPEGKARETRRGGRKGSPPGRNLKLGTRGDRATPRSQAGSGKRKSRTGATQTVTQEATASAAPRDQRRAKRPGGRAR